VNEGKTRISNERARSSVWPGQKSCSSTFGTSCSLAQPRIEPEKLKICQDRVDREHQIGLYQGANMGLLKTVFEVNLGLFGGSAPGKDKQGDGAIRAKGYVSAWGW
jgi:hypothetical protein